MRIDELLKSEEGKTLEFKRDLSSPQNILRTLVAFANTAGGVLLIGVEDRTHSPIGVENPLDQEERLCNLITDGIEPRLLPNIEIIAWEDHNLLLIEVFTSPLKPHWLKKQGPEAVLVRLGSTNRQADGDLIAELRRNAVGATFDEQPLPEFDADAIDMEAVRKIFQEQRKISEKQLETLRVFTRAQGRLVPTVGGLLLFGQDRERVFPDAWVQCGRFAGRDKTRIFDHTEIHEHPPVAVEQIMDFLKKHAMCGADLSQLRRRDVWSIPLAILREAVINAVVHADYSQKGAPIRVSFFDDRIEIENPGILLPGLTVEDILQGVSRLRNRVIARVFKELGLIEQWGSGIRRMFDEAEKLGLPSPGIEEIGMRYRFTVFLPMPIPIAGSEKEITSHSKSGLESGLESGTSRRVLLALSSIPLPRSEIARKLGLERVSGSINRAINELQEKKLIEMTIPDKPNSRLQKYRLTGKGKKTASMASSEPE